MEKAVDSNLDAALLTYGEYLLTRDNDKARVLLQKAFDKWYEEFTNNSLDKNNFSRLIRVSRQLGRMEVAEAVKSAFDKFKEENITQWYNEDNLASDNKIYLPEIKE